MEAKQCFPEDFARATAIDRVRWRWDAAGTVGAQRKRKRSGMTLNPWSDHYVLAAAKYQRRPAGAKSKSPADQLIEQAHAIFSGPEIPRWRLEARLLSGLPIGEVALAEFLDAATVEWYAMLFFDVVGSLDATDYIQIHAIRRKPSQSCPLQPADLGETVKLIAFRGGPKVLSAVLCALGWQTASDSLPEGAPAGLVNQIHAMLLIHQVPAEEFRLILTLQGDQALLNDSELGFPTWLTSGIAKLASESADLGEIRAQKEPLSNATLTPGAGEQRVTA